MSGKELINYLIEHDLEDKEICVGCQGYSSNDSEEDEIKINLTDDGKVLIHDCGYYPNTDMEM